VPVQAKGKTRTGRLWAYVRDDQPFGGPDPPAAAFFYSPDRGGEHPERHLASYVGLMQADAYAGFNRLYEATRKGGPIIEAACWAHGRRKFFDLARLQKAPIAIEAIERIDALFAVEREINASRPNSASHRCSRSQYARRACVCVSGRSRDQPAARRSHDSCRKMQVFGLLLHELIACETRSDLRKLFFSFTIVSHNLKIASRSIERTCSPCTY
jgi:hypothetical protein